MTKAELLDHIKTFYNDTSRSRADTKDALEEMQDEIDLLIETLKD